MKGWERVTACFTGASKENTVPPKGEIWIVKEILESEGLPDGPEGIVGLLLNLKADLCFFSCRGFLPVALDIDRMKEAVNMAKSVGLACGAVVDGPWQRLSESENIMQLLLMVRGKNDYLLGKLATQASEMEKEVAAWKKAGVDLLLVADDIAHKEGPYFSPQVFNRLLIPFYEKCIGSISASENFRYGFHSDGNLGLIMPALIEKGFTFFSIEPEAMDLETIWRLYGRQTVLMSGIRADWLTPWATDKGEYPDCRDILKQIKGKGNLILTSTCGLFHPYSVSMLEKIYTCIDNYYT